MSKAPSQNKERKKRLADLWERGDLPSFAEVAFTELRPEVVASVRGPNVSTQDAEDAFSVVVTKLLARRPAVPDPQAYIWRAVKNDVSSLFRARDRQPMLPFKERDSATELGREFDVESLAVLVEAFAADAEFDDTRLAEVVSRALTRLPTQPRRVVEFLLESGFDVLEGEGGSRLAMKAGTFRQYKKRAFDTLRVHIPLVMRDMGLDVSRYIRDLPGVFAPTWTGPGVDEED